MPSTVAKSVLTRVRDVQETILILVFFIDAAHQSRSRRQDLVDKYEDRLLGRELDPLADHIDKLTHGQIRWYEILLFVYGRNVRFFSFLADNRNAIGILLADALSFRLALLERMLIFELGPHDVGCCNQLKVRCCR